MGVRGVAAPSANRFGRVSPTQAAHVADEFGPELLILDGGNCELGIESSIVDCSRARPVLLRPGVLTLAALEAAAGEPLVHPVGGGNDAPAPRASGTLAAHYAPRATVRLRSAADLADMAGKQWPPGVAVYSRTLVPSGSTWSRQMPAEALAAAHELFSVLRELDAAGAQQIWIESAPSAAEWDGVRDRLSRAAAAFEEPESG
jgi:L-threonylcarbamoyladenylate synthase